MPEVDAYRELVGGLGLSSVTVWGENADRLFPDVGAMLKWLDNPAIVP